MFYSLTGNYPSLARHILDAQNSGLPGGRFSSAPLTRLVNGSLQDTNNRKACHASDVTYVRITDVLSCDEYPFQSTYEGAFTGGGDPRTYPYCGIVLPQASSTGLNGYSICMISAPDNEKGGSALQRGTYVPSRVINGDAFWVTITP